jgi:hypothetical protein
MKTIPTLPRLRSFALDHGPMADQDEVNLLCPWISQVVSSSRLESLHLSGHAYKSRMIDLNDFILSLAQQHATTLRFLYLDSLCIGEARSLCESFPNLMELSVVDYGGIIVRVYIVHYLLYSLLTITAFTVGFHGIHFKNEEAPHNLLHLPFKYAYRRSGRYGKWTAVTETDISERHYVGGW